jgi:hypothetical protein
MKRPFALGTMFAVGLAVLSGCGPEMEQRAMQAAVYTSSIFLGAGSTPYETGPTVSDNFFTAEAVQASPENFQLFTINALGIAELARVLADNGESKTWISQSGFTASFENGILVATRGLVGEDIMAASSPGLLQSLQAGGGTSSRIIEKLDSLNKIERMTFSCTVVAAGTETINLGVRETTGRRFNENCRGETLIFDNIYWLDASGAIIASRQYVSPTVAYLRSNRV